MKKYFLLALVALLGFGLVGCSGGKSSGGINIVSNYESASEYTQYLTETDQGDAKGDIEGYMDGEAGAYELDIVNNSDYFYVGDITVYDASDKELETYTTLLLRPGDYDLYTLNVEEEPSTFKNTNDKFYILDYPENSTEYTIDYDLNDTEHWMDLLVAGDVDATIAEGVVKEEYVVEVLTSMMYDSYYVFDSNYTTYYDEAYDGDYPDVTSAKFKAVIDYKAKTITLYGITDGTVDSDPVTTITMK